jgi:hypothetical protein
MQSRCRDLIEKGLKEVVVVFVDQDDIGFGTAKRARGGDSGETSPNDHHSRLSQIHSSSSPDP